MDFSVSLPQWLQHEISSLPESIPNIDEQMAHVIKCSRLNIEHDTGGPFAAAVFEKESGKHISTGVNRVMPEACSSAHAEVVALSMAQKLLSTWDLSSLDHSYQLVVNWRPCIMCYGAVIWSGVQTLITAGDSHELETITGFDEGPVPDNWIEELNKRGIDVINNIGKSDAIEVYRAFKQSGKHVYNARSNVNI